MSNYNDFPIEINSTKLPTPKVWTENALVVENELTTEAGTDIVDIMRVDKMTVNASFDVSSNWYMTFKGWANSTSSLTVKFYDSATNAYLSRYMRMRNFIANFVEHSDNVSGTYGLWEISFDLIEF